MPLRIFRSPTLACAGALTILIGTIAVGMPFLLTLYAQQVLAYSALKFGISSVVLALGATADAIAARPPRPAWRWRSCSPVDRGSQRTSGQSRTRRPMPLPQVTW